MEFRSSTVMESGWVHLESDRSTRVMVHGGPEVGMVAAKYGGLYAGRRMIGDTGVSHDIELDECTNDRGRSIFHPGRCRSTREDHTIGTIAGKCVMTQDIAQSTREFDGKRAFITTGDQGPGTAFVGAVPLGTRFQKRGLIPRFQVRGIDEARVVPLA